MKKSLPFIIFGGALLLYLVLVLSQPTKINWSETYNRTHKTPYGTYILFDLKESIFGDAEHHILSQDFYSYSYTHEFNSVLHDANYIAVNKVYKPDSLSFCELLSHVSNGNTAFITAEEFSKQVMDTLGFEIIERSNLFTDSLAGYNYTNPKLRVDSLISLPRMVYVPYVRTYDPTQTSVLGYYMMDDEEYLINYVRIRFGDGQFLIHTTPKVFTNYHILEPNGDESIYAALSYMPESADLIWEDHLKPKNQNTNIGLSFIFEHPSLTMAYRIMIYSLLAYILFFAKRRQKPIKVIEPLKNTTLNFIRTVSMLYYDKANHSEAAHMKVAFFLEYIANTFQVNPHSLGEKELKYISQKSGVTLQRVQFLFKHLSEISQNDQVDDYQLILLNGYIEDFHNKSLL